MFTKMKFCYCRHGYEVLMVINATDVCFLAKIPQNVRSDLFVCSLMDLMISDILKLHLCTISAVWDETTDIHYFLWLSSSYAEVELRIFWRNVGRFPKISRPLRHIKFWNMIGIWSVTWLFRTKKSSESSPTDVNKMAGYWLVISHRHDGTVMVLPLTCCLAAKWVQYSPH